MIEFSFCKNNVKITVDKRTTILSIIEILSEYKERYPRLLSTYGNKNYIEEVQTEFKEYQNSPIIKKFNVLLQQYDFSFSRPIRLFLELEEDLTFDESKKHEFLLNYNDIQMISLLKSISSFAQEIGFDNFYKKQENRFHLYINNVYEQLKESSIYSFLQKYYGVPISKKLVVNLIPWRTYGCYGTQNEDTIFTHLCCHHSSTKEEDMYPVDASLFNYDAFLFHEFSHSFINPIVDTYLPLKENIDLFSNFSRLHEIGYGSNDSIVKDYLVRAVTQRYLYHTNSNYLEKQRELDMSFGFEEMDDFIELFIDYELKRNQYINFENYFKEFVQNLRNKMK